MIRPAPFLYINLSTCPREWRPGSSRCWQPTASQQSLSQTSWLSICHPSILPIMRPSSLTHICRLPRGHSLTNLYPWELKNRSTRDAQLLFSQNAFPPTPFCFPFCPHRIIPTFVKRVREATLKSLPEDKMPDQSLAKFAKCKHCQTTLYVTTQDCFVCLANPWQHCGNLICGGLPPTKHNPSPKKSPGQSSINKSLWVGHKEDQGRRRQRGSKNKVDDFEEVKEAVGDSKDVNEEVGMVGEMDP